MNGLNLDLAKTALNEPLIERIRAEIAEKNGSISFARYMELALYTPHLGYYAGTLNKIGREGDFVTAPSISPLFADCLSVQCQQVLDALGGGNILEFGAGTGVLAKDLLLALEKKNALPDQYYIIEVSHDLRLRQQSLLKQHCPHLYDRIQWLDQLIEMKGIILANEVMDAFPVHCFRVDDQEIKERCVTYNHGFKWMLRAANDNIKNNLKEYDFPNGYESEINLNIAPWIESIVTHLKQGVILLSDYGYARREYYHPDRTMGTLMCYYQHRRHDNPFVLVGLQDITAHVDFTSVIESAFDAGAELGGYTTQAGFLLSTGLLDHVEKDAHAVQKFKEGLAIKTLTLPSEMGEAIKVMALKKNMMIELKGFQIQDRRRDL